MKPRIFVSAVSKELKSARQLIANTLTALGYEPVWQDIFGISSDKIRPMLRQKVESCSAVLQIVGNAYGAEPREPDEAFGRVSYTQYEALYAHSIGKKVYYLVAQSDMPRDAEPASIDLPRGESEEARADVEERRRLQQAYRATIQAKEHIYYSVHNQSETELAVRRLKDDLEVLRRGFKSWMIGVSVGLVAIALGVTWLMWGLPKSIKEAQKKAEEQVNATAEEAKKQVKEELESAVKKLTDPAALAERIRTEIVATAEKRIKALPTGQGQGSAISQIERERDLAVDRVDDLIKLLNQGLEEGATQIFQRAAEILQREGTDEALAYLESKRELTLNTARHHADQAKAALSLAESEKALRNKSLRALALEAELLESKLQWDTALRIRLQVVELAPDWSEALNRLGKLRFEQALYVEAEPDLRAALRLATNTAEESAASNNLAMLLKETNRIEKAEPLMRRALAIDEKNYGDEHFYIARDLNNLAVLLQDTNREAEAEQLTRRALAIGEKATDAEAHQVVANLSNLAKSLRDRNRLAEAESLVRRALAIEEHSHGPASPKVGICLNNLAQLLQATNRPAEAEPLIRRALIIHQKSFEDDHPSVGNALNSLAQLLQATNRLAEAEPLMRRSLEIDLHAFGEEHPSVATALNNLARLLIATNRLTEAEPLLRRSVIILRLFEIKTGHKQVYLQNGLDLYGRILSQLKYPSDKIEQQIKSVMEAAGPLEPIAPEVERLLGPAKPVPEVLSALDRQYKADGKPAIYFLKADQPIAGHLDELLKPNSLYLLLTGADASRNRAYADAIVLYDEAIRLQEGSPGNSELMCALRINRAAALRELGEMDKARDELRLLLPELDKEPPPPLFAKGRARYHLALCEWRLGDVKAAVEVAEASIREYGEHVETANLKLQSESLLADLKANKPPPPAPTLNPQTELEAAKSRYVALTKLASLSLEESVSPLLDQILGPAKSTTEVLKTLDQQYREAGKPEVWFLPLDKPIAPYLDELLGPLPSKPPAETR